VIEHLVWDNYIAYHTWETEKIKIITSWGFNLNPVSLGIELENRGDWRDPYTDQQIKALEELTLFLAKKYKIVSRKILGHKETTIRKIDPSPNFYQNDMTGFRSEMKKRLKTMADYDEGREKYKGVKGIKIFSDMWDNYEIKKLIEIWLLRYYKKQKHWLLKIRKD